MITEGHVRVPCNDDTSSLSFSLLAKSDLFSSEATLADLRWRSIASGSKGVRFTGKRKGHSDVSSRSSRLCNKR